MIDLQRLKQNKQVSARYKDLERKRRLFFAMPKFTHTEAYKLLCTLLVARRKELGITQYDLARRLNCPQSIVAKIERGDRGVDIMEFLDLARALETDVCKILLTIEAVYYNEPGNRNE